MEELGFMTYTAASQQGVIRISWLHFWEAVVSSIFIYLYVYEQKVLSLKSMSHLTACVIISPNPLNNHYIMFIYWNVYLLSISELSGKDGCYLWTKDAGTQNQEKADAITVEATAYALLTAVALQKTQAADKAACWLVTQENYFGGFVSSQVITTQDWQS